VTVFAKETGRNTAAENLSSLISANPVARRSRFCDIIASSRTPPDVPKTQVK
jgi:hypothetical protein